MCLLLSLETEGTAVMYNLPALLKASITAEQLGDPKG